MGRAATPTALKILRGNPGQRPITPDPVSHEPSLEPPKGLNRQERVVWRRVAAELDYMGVLKAADRDALVGYCQAVAVMPQVKPGSCEWDRVLRNVRLFAHEFGLTPSSRAKLSAPAVTDDGESLIT